MGKINFIDLGTHKGEEIEMFLQEVKNRKIDYSIYGFEAMPKTYQTLKKNFSSRANINIYNYAITDKQGIVKIYKSSSSLGNSIYKTKNNVNPALFEEVNSISIVDWIKDNIKTYKEDINILRFNIEGAELLLIKDLINKDFSKHIDLFLGARKGADILKCKEIADQYSNYLQLLEKNNIEIHYYCEQPSKSVKIFDILNNIPYI
jgi:FkbM family methyltransferase